jgi:hypothetical protein
MSYYVMLDTEADQPHTHPVDDATGNAEALLAGAGWQQEPHHCLVLAAKRIVFPYASVETLDELRRVARRMENEGWFKHHNPWPVLNWSP